MLNRVQCLIMRECYVPDFARIRDQISDTTPSASLSSYKKTALSLNLKDSANPNNAFAEAFVEPRSRSLLFGEYENSYGQAEKKKGQRTSGRRILRCVIGLASLTHAYQRKLDRLRFPLQGMFPTG